MRENIVKRNPKKRSMSQRSSKKSSSFKTFMWVYAGMWIVLTLVLCIFLWKSLANYQANYDMAEAAGRPELAMDEAITKIGQTSVKGLVEDMQPEVLSRFESLETYKEFYYNFLEGKELTYVKNEEHYNDARPVYDVYAGEDLYAIVSLKAAGVKDEFGFNQWEVSDVVISENHYEYHDVYLKVMKDMEIYINGIKVEESEFVRENSISNELSQKAYELTGKDFGYQVYYAGDMIAKPEVKVFDAAGNDITENYTLEENELKSYVSTASEEFVAGVSERVQHFCQTYLYHIYRKASAMDVLGMMVDGSEAEAILYDIQSTLAWAWVPDTVEILNEEYSDFVYYNDEYFTCKSTISLRKADEKQEEIEEFSYQWLFKNVNGEWQVTYFVLV